VPIDPTPVPWLPLLLSDPTGPGPLVPVVAATCTASGLLSGEEHASTAPTNKQIQAENDRKHVHIWYRATAGK
jgi:hypothetical protein